MYGVIFPYIRLAGVLLAATFLSYLSAPVIFPFLLEQKDAGVLFAFFNVAAIFAASFFAFYAANKTAIPSFVIAIFFGLAMRPILAPAVSSETLLTIIVGLGATFILFGGGLETKLTHFKTVIGRILLLSFPGMILTAVLFSLAVVAISAAVGHPLGVPAAVLLGAVLASTDPAAIIPILKKLRFKDECTRTLIISESAVTDAVGALLTVTFLALILSGAPMESVLSSYTLLASTSSVLLLFEQFIVGTLFGLLGFLLLEVLIRFKGRETRDFEADTAFFLFVPIVTFTAAHAFGGSGYLAVFITGLFFNLKEHLHDSDQFFNRSIDGFLKPTIFLLLGAMIDIETLLKFAPIGILCALAFIFIIRPATVFSTLTPFLFFGKKRATLRDLAFISFVRETGAIPAVLLITIAGAGLAQSDALIAVGMWVILLTLLIEPPLTPWIAKKLGVAEEIKEEDVVTFKHLDESFVVLATRGYSYARRLPLVARWAARHNIKRVVVLLCLEGRYSKHREKQFLSEAEEHFEKISTQLTTEGLPPVSFSIVSNKGFLQENIAHLAEKEPQVVAIFLGRRVLDFRLQEIKSLSVPLHFVD